MPLHRRRQLVDQLRDPADLALEQKDRAPRDRQPLRRAIASAHELLELTVTADLVTQLLAVLLQRRQGVVSREQIEVVGGQIHPPAQMLRLGQRLEEPRAEGLSARVRERIA